MAIKRHIQIIGVDWYGIFGASANADIWEWDTNDKSADSFNIITYQKTYT